MDKADLAPHNNDYILSCIRDVWLQVVHVHNWIEPSHDDDVCSHFRLYLDNS